MAGGAENERWAVSVGEDGNVEVNRDVTEDRSGSGMLDGRWNFSWDECRVSDKEDTEICEVMSLVGLVDNTWSEVALSSEEKTGKRVVMQVMFVILVEQSENLVKNVRFWVEGCCWGW